MVHATVQMKCTVILCLVLPCALVTGNCPKGCDNLNVPLYESMGCVPKYANTSDCCPTEYDCATVINTPPQHCHFQGVYYKEHEVIPSSLTEPGCEIYCNCEQIYQSNGSYAFRCGALDCPELLGSRLKEGCFHQYNLQECCATTTICPPFDKLAICEVDGKIYYEGQSFWPQKCTSCICKGGFTGDFVEPFCRKFKCVTEANSMNQIDNYYAPHYWKKDACCPFGWLKPSNDDPLVKSTSRSESRCRFGSKYYDIGASLVRVESKNEFLKHEYNCTCEIPPFLTCLGKEIWDSEKTPEHLRYHLSVND